MKRYIQMDRWSINYAFMDPKTKQKEKKGIYANDIKGRRQSKPTTMMTKKGYEQTNA